MTASVHAAFGPCPGLSGAQDLQQHCMAAPTPRDAPAVLAAYTRVPSRAREPCDWPMTRAAPPRTSPFASHTQPPTTSAKPRRTAEVCAVATSHNSRAGECVTLVGPLV